MVNDWQSRIEPNIPSVGSFGDKRNHQITKLPNENSTNQNHLQINCLPTKSHTLQNHLKRNCLLTKLPTLLNHLTTIRHTQSRQF